MRTSEITQRPVVTIDGDDVAQVKDIVYAAGGGAVGGFTLAGRGIFAGPLGVALPWSSVSALGTDAVMIADASVLEAVEGVVEASTSSGGNVLGSQVLTDEGTELGVVVDVIVEVSHGDASQCDVVGYEIEASEALGTKGTKLLIPLPDTLAASGEHLIVPANAKNFVRQDLAGFGAAVEDFRAQLGGQR
jgi:uncharacterized protein YrrD